MLRIGITSRALFNLILVIQFLKNGLEAYRKHQISNENIPLEKVKLSSGKEALNLNKLSEKDLVEVILLSRNSPDTGLRIFNSIEYHGLNIKKAAFCGGNSPYIYAKSFETHLFLSADLDDCRLSTLNGIPSARIMLTNKINNSDNLLRIAFDGDSVIFSDDSQLIFENYGLEALTEMRNLANEPLSKGPFQSFLEQLAFCNNHYQEKIVL